MTAARAERHLAEPLANGSTLRPEFRPYRWRDPDASPERRAMRSAIRMAIGPEEDSWDSAPPVVSRRVSAQYVKPCGTNAAYARHLRHGEEPCADCRRAHCGGQEWLAGHPRPRKPEPSKQRAEYEQRLAALAGMKLHTGFESTPPPGYITAAEAAQRLGVHVRTVTRYLERLREAS